MRCRYCEGDHRERDCPEEQDGMDMTPDFTATEVAIVVVLVFVCGALVLLVAAGLNEACP